MSMRAITAGEKTKLRSSFQGTLLRLDVDVPPTVFSARINQTFTTLDMVAQISLDTVTGNWADIVPGMTVLIGTAAGAYDIGIARVRKTPANPILYIGETSEIAFADDQYVTVVLAFEPHQRAAKKLTPGEDAEDYMMDFDIVYTDQHSKCDPIVIMGSNRSVKLVGATVSILPDASDSWVPNDTIASWSWSAPGASATSGMNTATPTITYNAIGRYTYACTATTVGGASYTGYRRVRVWSAAAPLTTQFTLESCDYEYSSGGWKFEVTLYDEALLTEIRERAWVALVAEDVFQGVRESLGYEVGCENIVACGWVARESIDLHIDEGFVKFTVQHPMFWLNAMHTFTMGWEDHQFAKNPVVPTTWVQMINLCTDWAVWGCVHWRSTIDMCTDVYPTGDTKQAETISAPRGTLGESLLTIAQSTIMAKPVCDHLGRLFILKEQQYLTTGEKAAIPVVMALTKDDITHAAVGRRSIPALRYAEVTGIYYVDGRAAPMGAKAPGEVPRRIGEDVLQQPELVMGDQADSLTLASNVGGAGAGDLDTYDTTFAENNRFVDIAPHSWWTTSIAASETVRGIVKTNARMIPRGGSFDYDLEYCILTQQTNFEFEGTSINSVKIDFPGEKKPPVKPPKPPPPKPPVPPPPPPPPPFAGIGARAIAFVADDVRTTDDFVNAASPTWNTEIGGSGPSGIIDGDIMYFEAMQNTAYAITDTEIWRATYVRATGTATWEIVWQESDATKFDDVHLLRVRCCNAKNRVYVLAYGKTTAESTYDAYLLVSNNDGLTWAENLITETAAAEAQFTSIYKVEVCDWYNPPNPDIYWSTLHGRVENGEDHAPWGLIFQWEQLSGDDIWGSFIADTDTLHGFGGSNIYEMIIPRLYWNEDLTVGEKGILEAYCDELFGAGNWDEHNPGEPMPNEPARVNWEGRLTHLGTGEHGIVNLHQWSVWHDPHLDAPSALDYAHTNNDWVYVGLKEGLVWSDDGGFTWYAKDLLSGTLGVNDIRVDPLAAGVIYFWDTDGNLCTMIAEALQPSLLAETYPSRQYCRIICDPLRAGWRIWALASTSPTVFSLKKRNLASWATMQTGISDGKSLRSYYYDPTYVRLVWMDGGEIYTSVDDGATAVNKTGVWAPTGTKQIYLYTKEYDE